MENRGASGKFGSSADLPRIHTRFLQRQRVNIRLFESRKGDVDHVPRNVPFRNVHAATVLSLSLSFSPRFVASQSANRLPLNRAIYGSRDRKRGSFRGGLFMYPCATKFD